jgi:hypothetical protein
MLNRAAFLAITGTLLWPGVAISSPRTRTISETQKVADVATVGKVGTVGRRVVVAGALNGRIGATPVHGALRAYSKVLPPGRETVRGTEFDAGGSRSYVIHVQVTGSKGRIRTAGTGHWIGGTGVYAHARGAFKTTGRGKIVAGAPGGYLTIHLKGSITY